MNIELAPEDLNNLMVFLNRVQISGQEAVTFVMLQQKLLQAQQTVPTVPQPDENGPEVE